MAVWWFGTSRGLNTYQLVRPSLLSVEGFVHAVAMVLHGTLSG